MLLTNILTTATLFLGLTSAYTQPKQPPSWGALTRPDTTHPVTKGVPFRVTWDYKAPAKTVSLVICRGPPTNCKPDPQPIKGGSRVPASQGYVDWTPACHLPPGKAGTQSGYGMLVIVDETGEFQYSTQFSVLANPSVCAKKAMFKA
ncbi:Ecp44 [Fulvia fulva]|uniref:Ecp44 n=1 Tax=Passalora fulva TaxID=5499 RepID=A0A1P8YXM7_PASFU|nr:Ecp44 [Fulvia fulva]AQA29263.1 extracellular protein 44 [Fulvia fulva]KAK4619618.1 Ecp44 [Fulvia fulva]KAK4620828.1 Ecp44 [Fulvia fulva]UJO19650.1 Ecp44 [Fulvia fulva]WPV16977.1 Ecp44 [Fulvia fulva]